MPLYLRVITNLSRWEIDSDPSKLLVEQVPADPVTDLKTKSNSLSVFKLEDDKTNLDRIIAANAAMRREASVLHYILINSSILDSLNIFVDQTPGGTKDRYVNKNYHHDLKNLSAMQLVELVRRLLVNIDGGSRVPLEISECLQVALEAGWIPSLSKDLRESVDKQLGRC